MLCSLVSNVVSMLYNYQQRGQSWTILHGVRAMLFSAAFFLHEFSPLLYVISTIFTVYMTVANGGIDLSLLPLRSYATV